MKENILQIKSKKFAIRIINLYKYLTNEKNEFVISKQLLRSGTSIGANVAESEYASSENDFLNKLYISLKECNESIYWLELLKETEYLTGIEYNSLIKDCEEIKSILIASTKTIKNNIL